VTIEDFLLHGRKIDSKTYVRWSRLLSLFWMFVCVVVSFFIGNFAKTVIEAINQIGSLVYGPILMLFLLAILSKKTTGLSVNIGLLAGIAANIYVWKCQPQIFWFWWNVIGTTVTFIVVYVVRFLHPFALDFMHYLDKNAQRQQNMGLTHLQQNSIVSFPVSKECIEKCLTHKDNNLFDPQPIIWNRQIIGYSIAFFSFMIFVSFLLERIL
jgi:Na+/proline symporter